MSYGIWCEPPKNDSLKPRFQIVNAAIVAFETEETADKWAQQCSTGTRWKYSVRIIPAVITTIKTKYSDCNQLIDPSDNEDDCAIYWSILTHDAAGYYFRNPEIAKSKATEDFRKDFQNMKTLYRLDVIHCLYKKSEIIPMNKWRG